MKSPYKSKNPIWSAIWSFIWSLLGGVWGGVKDPSNKFQHAEITSRNAKSALFRPKIAPKSKSIWSLAGFPPIHLEFYESFVAPSGISPTFAPSGVYFTAPQSKTPLRCLPSSPGVIAATTSEVLAIAHSQPPPCNIFQSKHVEDEEWTLIPRDLCTAAGHILLLLFSLLFLQTALCSKPVTGDTETR